VEVALEDLLHGQLHHPKGRQNLVLVKSLDCKPKKGAKLVMKEGINSPAGSARASAIKASAAERKARKEVSAAKKVKGPARQAKVSKAISTLEKARTAEVKALDKLSKATRRK
jgi:hypothetical protein